MQSFRDDILDELRTILASDFTIDLHPTGVVPHIGDTVITYPNLSTRRHSARIITTCVLHVDIRNSTDMGQTHRRQTMARLYSAFVRGMARAAEYYGGRVRNIVGDRITVFFDEADCFVNVVNTAILMNSVAQYVLNTFFTQNTVRCGIGIDYGTMLVSKVGIVKYGRESASHRELVWLGRPANVASKLADLANKTLTTTDLVVDEHLYYSAINEWSTYTIPVRSFLDKLKSSIGRQLVHPDSYFSYFLYRDQSTTRTNSPILMTDSVYQGFKKASPQDSSLRHLRRHSVPVVGYSGPVWGGDVVFTAFKQ